ncbi:MAG: hypothetical protein ACRCTQ_05125 [Brevinemataceae bacterium]
MNRRELLNFFSGFLGFTVWIILTYRNPEHAVNTALGSLLMLVGFGGRDTIINIIKIWKE